MAPLLQYIFQHYQYPLSPFCPRCLPSWAIMSMVATGLGLQNSGLTFGSDVRLPVIPFNFPRPDLKAVSALVFF